MKYIKIYFILYILIIVFIGAIIGILIEKLDNLIGFYGFLPSILQFNYYFKLI